MPPAEPLTLVIANKAYSSWSLRPWIALKTIGVPFEEILIPLDEPDTKRRILQHSPAGKVPILIDGEVRIWESLAILEYLAEQFPAAQLWPVDRAARAHARAVASEMHAGFAPLRQHYPMNVRKRIGNRPPTAEVQANIERIQSMWRECRERHSRLGPFLFGRFTAADAMYAPVVSRFETYAVPVDPTVRAYMDAVLGLPAFRDWIDAAAREPWVIAADEVG
jgi:glutathione S-transferase